MSDRKKLVLEGIQNQFVIYIRAKSVAYSPGWILGDVMLRIAICDDDKFCCGELESYVLEYAGMIKEHFEVDVYYSGEELLEDLRKDIKYELIFLDIEMREVDGIQTGSVIRKELDLFLTQIVYVTSFEQYAKELFQNQPFDFLTKPLQKEKVFSVIKEYQRRYDHTSIFYEFVSHRITNKVAVSDILFVNSQGRKILIHTKFETYETYEKLSNFLDSPAGETFIQISKSFAVNTHYISSYCYDHIIMATGEKIVISRNFRKEVREKLLAKTEI